MLFANRRPAHEIVAMSFIETLDNLALKKSELVERFENLIAPKSDQALEAMAQASRSLTRQNFGRTMRLFAPLYLSNECINNCRYCGFSRDNPILRVTLDVDEVVAEGQHLAHQGFRQILLVAGEHPKFVSRDYDEVDVSDAQLWNVYLPPFAAALEAGAGNVMTAYMDLNGVPASGNRWLFTDVLRGLWGFDGFVVSDAQAVRSLRTHGFAADLTDAAARAVGTGVDLEMATADPAYAHLPEAVGKGLVAEEVLDASVRRVL
ncbi:MAG: glycoside hydrolase family 3 N-terminal domain-containing protein, partial [Candidatus Udaeobacter sp.]